MGQKRKAANDEDAMLKAAVAVVEAGAAKAPDLPLFKKLKAVFK